MIYLNKLKIMTTDRIKEIQAETAYPDSTSAQQALLKVWNECQQKQNHYIDLAYLTGVFNVAGIVGLQKELARLREIGKNPRDIFYTRT